MNFEDLIVSERSQSPKDKYCPSVRTWGIPSSKTRRIREQSGGSRGKWGAADKWAESVNYTTRAISRDGLDNTVSVATISVV